MKYRLIITIFLLGVMILSACQSSNDAYPGPGEANPQTNQETMSTETPRPVVEPGQATYPEITTNTEVGWYQAEAMLLNGEVGEVVLKANLAIQLNLKDGRVLTSAQPIPDSVALVLKTCADLCKDTKLTEE